MIESILWIFFILACILTTAIILLQEGKGGGLGEAFGGAGQQMVGVKAEGITKATGYLAIVVVVLAIVITRIRKDGSSFQDGSMDPVGTPEVSMPAGDADGDGDGK